jgi:hypothetical protein
MWIVFIVSCIPPSWPVFKKGAAKIGKIFGKLEPSMLLGNQHQQGTAHETSKVSAPSIGDENLVASEPA